LLRNESIQPSLLVPFQTSLHFAHPVVLHVYCFGCITYTVCASRMECVVIGETIFICTPKKHQCVRADQ